MNALNEFRDRAWARWLALGTRDRILLALWSAAVLLLLLWFALLSPMQHRIKSLEQRVPELESRLSRMRSQAADLAHRAPAARTSEGDLRSALFGRLAERKMSAELRPISSSRVEIRLPELPITDALDLLDQLRHETGSRVAQLSIKTDKSPSPFAKIVVEMERAP